MPDTPFNSLLSAFGRVVDSIKINAVRHEVRDGREVWVKRRRRTSGPIIRCANLFFKIVRNPVRVWTSLEEWQRWEVFSFQSLNGDRYLTGMDGKRAVYAEQIPGITISDHLERGSITPEMYQAAARELRAGHEVQCEEFAGPWSHGDAHLANFIFDDATRRARMIDFDLVHEKSLTAAERHADDLLIFLQDMVGRISAEDWLPAAHCFLKAYDRPDVIRILRERLVVPGGMAFLWWFVRANYIKRGELCRRIAALREGIKG
jgi:hypothetical protein